MLSMKRNLALFIVVMLAPTGCASYRPQPLMPEASLAALDALRLDDAAALTRLRKLYPQHAWPPARWDLDSLTLVAADIHPEIAQAQAEYQVAEAGWRMASARLNPQLHLSGEHTTHVPTDQSLWTWGIGLDLLLETAGKRDARKMLAAQQIAVARAHLDGARWQLRARIRDALLAMAEAGDTQILMREQLTTITARAQALAKRVTLGLTARPDELAARAQVLEVQQALATATQKEIDARQQLASALGLTTAAVATLPLSLLTGTITPPPNARSLRVQALRQRADLQAALAEYAASEARLQLEIAKQYPSLTLSPGYAWDAQSVMWSLGVGAVLPVLNHNQPAIAEAEANRQLARTRFEALQLGRHNAIDQAMAAEVAARQAQTLAADAASVARRRLQAADAALAAGATDRVQLLDVREAQASVQQAELTARFTHIRTLAALEDALQIPLSTYQDTTTP